MKDKGKRLAKDNDSYQRYTNMIFCKLCSLEFPNKDAYSDHVKGNHFPYDKCSSVLKTQNTFRKQKRIYHKEERNFQCKYCDKSFVTAHSLALHRSVHYKNNKEHVCDSCRKVFYKISHLGKHKTKVHTDPLKCGMCEKEHLNKNFEATWLRIILKTLVIFWAMDFK